MDWSEAVNDWYKEVKSMKPRYLTKYPEEYVYTAIINTIRIRCSSNNYFFHILLETFRKGLKSVIILKSFGLKQSMLAARL